jgi:flagellar basal body-associated protein FliL
MKQNDASLRDAATTIISGQSSASLDNPNGREAFRKQLIAEFNRLLGGEVIDQIYFSKFSIQ